MVGMIKSDQIEDVVIIGGLIGMQFVYAGNAVFLSYLMSLGISPLTIVIFVSLATFIIIFPVAFYFERNNWPTTLSWKLFTQFFLLAFGGVTLFQSLLLKGIKLTSPAMGTAMPNLAPGLIFIIAWTSGIEKVNIRCTYSKVKILGTLMCVLGALTMSIMQSISSAVTARQAQADQLSSSLSSTGPHVSFDKHKVIGCLYLMAAIFMLSSTIVLQAFTLGDFPAPMTLSAATSLFGAFMTVIAQLLEDHQLTAGLPLVSVGDMLGYSLLGGAVGGLCLSFNGWALKKRGPVMVSMFSPIGTVISVVLSVVTLGDTINIGSLAGMFLMFTGLYFVLWAKGKEGYSNGDRLEKHPIKGNQEQI